MTRARSWRPGRAGCLALAAAAAAACARPPGPPAELARGHLEWRDAAGRLRVGLRATPSGYRLVDSERRTLAVLERQAGALVATVDGARAFQVAPGPAGLAVDEADGGRRHLVRELRGERLIETAARFPIGRVIDVQGVVTAANAGGLPVGSVRSEGDRLLLRARDGAVVGSVTGGGEPRDVAVLLLEEVPLAERAALLAVTLPVPPP